MPGPGQAGYWPQRGRAAVQCALSATLLSSDVATTAHGTVLSRNLRFLQVLLQLLSLNFTEVNVIEVGV